MPGNLVVGPYDRANDDGDDFDEDLLGALEPNHRACLEEAGKWIQETDKDESPENVRAALHEIKRLGESFNRKTVPPLDPHWRAPRPRIGTSEEDVFSNTPHLIL